jgi:hypothetical protein
MFMDFMLALIRVTQAPFAILGYSYGYLPFTILYETIRWDWKYCLIVNMMNTFLNIFNAEGRLENVSGRSASRRRSVGILALLSSYLSYSHKCLFRSQNPSGRYMGQISCPWWESNPASSVDPIPAFICIYMSLISFFSSSIRYRMPFWLPLDNTKLW